MLIDPKKKIDDYHENIRKLIDTTDTINTKILFDVKKSSHLNHCKSFNNIIDIRRLLMFKIVNIKDIINKADDSNHTLTSKFLKNFRAALLRLKI